MFPFFIEKKLIAANQSDYKPGDSCISQLIAITHTIYQSFDAGYDVRGVFLDISKAFDKVEIRSYFQVKTKWYFM